MTTPLITRLEEAAEGSRELDALIAVEFDLTSEDGDLSARRSLALYGLEKFAERASRYNNAWREFLPHYTTSIDAALALAERVLPGIIWTVCRLPSGNTLAKHGPFYATLESDDEWSPMLDQSAATPALALCIAILKATHKDKP